MKFKVKNILLVSFLAIAGFFGVGSTLINKQVNEQPVVEEAEAVNATWDGSMTKIIVNDIWQVRTLKLAGTFQYTTGYDDDKRDYFIKQYYSQEYKDWQYETTSKRYYIQNANSILLSAGVSNNQSVFYLPSWIEDVSEVYLINSHDGGNTFHCGHLNNLLQWPKNGWLNTAGDYAGSAVSCTVTFDNFGGTYSTGDAQCKGVRNSSTNTGTQVTTNWKWINKTDTFATKSVTTYQYGLPPSTESIADRDGYIKVSNSWYVGDSYSASSVYSAPKLIMNNSAINLVAKYIGARFVYFTDNLNWGSLGTIYCWYTGGSVESGFSAGNAMKPLYSNGSNWIYYTYIPEDTTKIGFDVNHWANDRQTVDISLTSITLDNTNAWAPNYTTTGNKQNVNSWNVTSDRHPLFGGEVFYLYITNESDAEDCAYAVKFCNQVDGTIKESVWSSKAEKITDSKDAFGIHSHIYKVTVPNGINTIWASMQLARYNPSLDPTVSGDSGAYNIANFSDLTTTFTSANMTGYTGSTSSLDNKYNESNIYSTIFGYHVLTQTNGVCKQDGTTTDVSDLAEAWTTLKTEYNEYNSSIQGAIWTATTTGSDNLSKGMKRYDYIALYKYPNLIGSGERDTDFVHRADSNNRAFNKGAVINFSPFKLITGSDDESNISTIIIIVASSVALLSVTALSILVIKKRKNKE